MGKPSLLAVLAVSVLATGCVLPKTTVVRDPGPRDRGVRYYRPKPYLMVSPLVNRDGEPVAGFVTLETQMLPDFSEEYSIHVRTGLGTNETSITLADGWNLTGLNVNVDAQVDDNLRAVADVVGSVPVATEGPAHRHTVRAINVPMGLYESVVSSGPDGRKRLYGFRYVGFFPYAPCPLQSGGEACQPCGAGGIYGLAFDEESGAMVFRSLEALRPDASLAEAASRPEPLPEALHNPAALVDDVPRT